MDPDATLEDLRALAKDVLRKSNVGTVTFELADKFAALDEWLMKGGFLPSPWEEATARCHHQPNPEDIRYSGDNDLMICYCKSCGRRGSFTFKNHTAEIDWEETSSGGE